MYGSRMIACQCITVSGIETMLLLSVTIVVNGFKWVAEIVALYTTMSVCLSVRPTVVLEGDIRSFHTWHLGSLKLDFREKGSSRFMEGGNATDFEAKAERGVDCPADFGGLSRAVERFFDLGPILCVRWLQKLNFGYTWSRLGYVRLKKVADVW